jgi:hypothetical protein
MAGARAIVALTLLLTLSRIGRSQDTTAVARHLLALDISRVQPFARTYDMIVRARDSSIVIGQREIVVKPGGYSDAPAWLIVETRSGLVPAVESLYVGPDLRPLHWSSTLGSARLGAEFVGDSVYGAVTMGTSKQNIVVNGRPDLVVSGPMLEMLLPLLPLRADWVDSVGVLGADLVANQVTPAELAVIAEEELPVDSSTSRPSWVIALRAGERHVLLWIDKETGAALRVRQPLPPHVGAELEYRLRRPPDAGPVPPR